MMEDALTLDDNVQGDLRVDVDPSLIWDSALMFHEKGPLLFFTARIPLAVDVAYAINSSVGKDVVDKVIFNDNDVKSQFLAQHTIFLCGLMAHVFPWKPVKAMKEELLYKCPVWVESVDLPSFLWNSIGHVAKVLAPNKNRVCVLWNTSKSFPETLGINVPSLRRIVIYLKWGNMAGSCFHCYKGNWNLNVWNKFFSHVPVCASSHTLNILLQSFKQFGSTLKWNGRQRYVGNSFASMSLYWSFLTTPPLALSLGAEARYFNNKGIDSISKCYDSKWEILSFPAIRRAYAVGSAYRSKWIQIAVFLQEYQVPLSVDFSDPWRDWLLAKHTRWWTRKANTFYPSLLPSDDLTLQCNARWKLQKSPSWWHARFSLLWESSLTFRMKIFMWRIFTGHFTLGAFLYRHGLQGVRCPHCASHDESMLHAFWTCSFIQRWWNKVFLFPIWDMRASEIGSTFFLFGLEDRVLDWIRERCLSLLLWNI
ncbi:hypothetical protein KP509_31G007800 [Ceratopteris richardii]|uniref:Reverse transcriptase zinc-binding domain-containing protein n=1 Tax=Ceratopteris richardii TaxID=49495 RepID=A0A8T2QVF2_CERRI|nr:hypothetical protein KP509_31G007800 [Ceratopteris richardii]